MTLYSINTYSPDIMTPQGFIGGGSSSTIYSIEVFDKFIRLGPKLKKKDFVHFSACPGLLDKLKNKELKRNNIYSLVNYFNLHYYDER